MFAAALSSYGYPAERGQQRAGGADSPDVRCPSLPGIHWEVKVYKTCQMNCPAMLAEWDEQARRDAGPDKLPVIAHKWARSPWWVRVLTQERRPLWQTLEDFLSDRATWEPIKEGSLSAPHVGSGSRG